MSQKIALFLCLTLLTSGIQAQNVYNLNANKIVVAGTSSLHDWESDVTKVGWSGAITVEDGKISEIRGVQVNIPVTSIKSSKGRIMDSKTYEAFDYEKNPNITFRMSDAKITGNQIRATGSLSLAGASRSIELIARYKTIPNGDIQISGSYKINMRDYKMEPPTAVMGTIKVGEEVTVSFDLMLSPDADTSRLK
ncbi:MAG: YceI family protein [Cyclobacteriaceae bacterium]